MPAPLAGRKDLQLRAHFLKAAVATTATTVGAMINLAL